MSRLAWFWCVAMVSACGGSGGAAPVTSDGGAAPGSVGGGSAASTSSGGAGRAGGATGGGVQEDFGSSPDRWTGSTCPASDEPGTLTLSFADGSCLPFTYDTSTFYNGAFLVSSKEGLRLDIEMLPDHSGVQSLALHPGPEDKPARMSYCYVYGFKSLCQGATVADGAARRVTFSDVIIKSKFDAAPEILLNGELTLADEAQTNTFVPVRDACGPATAIGRYGGCSATVLADFALDAGLARDSDASVCSISLEAGTLTFTNGSRVISAKFDGAGEDQLALTLNSQLWYTYRLDAGERLPGADNQLGAQVTVHIANDGIDSVSANYREKSNTVFETYTCRAQTPDQPWNHPWP